MFVMPANGGSARRLTTNSASEIPSAFTPDGKYVVFSASIQDPASSALFPTSAMTELYKVLQKVENGTNSGYSCRDGLFQCGRRQVLVSGPERI